MPIQYQVVPYNNSIVLYSYLPFPALLQGCKDCNKNVTNCKILHNIFDVKDWLLPNTEELRNHSHPHIFQFAKNGQHTVMLYKRWHQDAWEPKGKQGLKLLKV